MIAYKIFQVVFWQLKYLSPLTPDPGVKVSSPNTKPGMSKQSKAASANSTNEQQCN